MRYPTFFIVESHPDHPQDLRDDFVERLFLKAKKSLHGYAICPYV